MTMMGKATEKSLDEVGKVVLAPHFHVEGMPPQKVRTPFPLSHAMKRSGGPWCFGGDMSVACLGLDSYWS